MKWGLSKRKDNSDLSIDSFRKDINSFFDDFFSLKPSTLFESEWLPKVDVEEDDNGIHITAELPGMNEKDIQVSLDNDMLTISGEKREEKKEENKRKNYIVSERSYGSFSRTINMPRGIKADMIKAKFKNGILTIELPKDEALQPKKINIDVK